MTPGESHNEWYQYYCLNICPFNNTCCLNPHGLHSLLVLEKSSVLFIDERLFSGIMTQLLFTPVVFADWSSEINKLLFSACVISPEAVCRFSHLHKYVNLNQVHLPVNSLHAGYISFFCQVCCHLLIFFF